jgi:reversibly glycosylated polypeptide / UDP-arabinopyranose mutase
MEDLVDIVVTVENADINNDGAIEFLNQWQSVIDGLHCIVIFAKDLERTKDMIPPMFPKWLTSYEVYTHKDIVALWGNKAYLAGDRGISLRNFAYWVSDRHIVYSIDHKSKPLDGRQSDGYKPRNSHSKEDNIENSRQDHIHNQHALLRGHVSNLLTPATPNYYNTYHNAYEAGSDFPKGYPYQLRNGVHTGVSHGLSTGDIGYDRLTRLSKPNEQNNDDRVLPMTQTIPKGSLYSMASNNVAFNRRLVGGMFMYIPPVTLPDGEESSADNYLPSEEYSDVLSGWIIKAISDAVGIGVKSGYPYIHKKLNNNDSSIKSLKERTKEALDNSHNGMFLWQEELISWLSTIHIDFGDTNSNVNKGAGCHGSFFAPEYGDLNAAIDCAHLVLANAIDSQLVESLPGMKHVANSMRDWRDLWSTRNTFIPRLHPIATYASEGPILNAGNDGDKTHKKTTCAIITIVRDEKELLPFWLRHYSRHVNLHDMYILDHMTTDNSTHPSKIPKGVNYKVLYGNSYAMPVVFRSWQINKYQDRLLRYGYPCVIFGDTDEIIVPNPAKYPKGLGQYLEEFLSDDSRRYHRVKALEVGHISYGNGTKVTQEKPFDWEDPKIFSQRKVFIPDKAYDKPLLSKVPLRYRAGFHKLFTNDKITVDEDLTMLHMRSFDFEFCMRREEQKYNLSSQMKPEEIKVGMANHWTTYHKDKQSGELCKYAQASFFGEQSSSTQYLDNTGRIQMQTFGKEWEDTLV